MVRISMPNRLFLFIGRRGPKAEEIDFRCGCVIPKVPTGALCAKS
jgi:hypothetical protein